MISAREVEKKCKNEWSDKDCERELLEELEVKLNNRNTCEIARGFEQFITVKSRNVFAITNVNKIMNKKGFRTRMDNKLEEDGTGKVSYTLGVKWW